MGGSTSHDLPMWFAMGCVAAWLTGWAVSSIVKISRGDQRSVLFVQLVFYVFCGVPLILDIIAGPPVFPYQWGFIVSQYDTETNVAYLAYLFIIPMLFRFFGGKATPKGERHVRKIVLTKWMRRLAWIPAIALPLVIAASPKPSAYFHYAAVLSSTDQVNSEYQAAISALSSLVALGGSLILTAENSSSGERALIIPLLALATWSQGKRSAIALLAFLLLYLFWSRGSLRGQRLLAAGVATVLAVGGFSYFYQTVVRDVQSEMLSAGILSESGMYTNYRIDYGRDGVMKQTLFAELHPEVMQILEFRGESLLFDATFFVPRKAWPTKPYPYDNYVTSAMLRQPPGYQHGWGMTTSWLEEAIANLGWLGLIAGPLVPALVCRVGDSYDNAFIALLTVIVASLLLVLQLAAFLPLALLWIGLVLRLRKMRKKA